MRPSKNQTAHSRSKSYKSVYALMEDWSDCASAHQVTSRHMRQSKTQIRLRIRASKVTIRPSANQWLRSDCVFAHQKLQVGICAHQRIRLRIRAAKVTSRYMRPSKNQTAHSRSKSYKSAYAPIEVSDQTALMRSLIWVFDRHSMGSQGLNVTSVGKLRLIRL